MCSAELTQLESLRCRGGTAAVRDPLSHRLAWWGASAALVALSLMYSWRVAPGLPYDEPSHWGYARWVAAHWTLPQIGEPSVGYEAQMGPVGYLISAVVARVAAALGASTSMALHGARFAGLLAWGAAATGMFRLIGRCLPQTPRHVAAVGVAIALANPMVLGMSLSIQNDTVALALVIWLMVLVPGNGTRRPLWRAAAIGGLAGIAVLAKLVVVPAVVVLLLWQCVDKRPRGALRFGVSAAVAVAACGWWFVRNLVLYGDLTGRSGLHERLGLDFPPLDLPLPAAAVHLTRTAIAYLWLPGEYYRSTLHAPLILDVLIVLLTVGIVVGGGWAMRGRVCRTTLLLFAVAGVSILSWAWTAEFQQAVAFRTAYAALPAYGVLVAALSRYVRAPALMATSTVVLGCVHAWTLIQVSSISYLPGVRL